MSADGQDPVLRELREQVASVDRQVLDAINARLELVAQIRRHKAENGIDFLDPGREEWLLRHLATANPGPLSEEGVRELFATILALVKRELAGSEKPSA
jgi:chorismate mutase